MLNKSHLFGLILLILSTSVYAQDIHPGKFANDKEYVSQKLKSREIEYYKDNYSSQLSSDLQDVFYTGFKLELESNKSYCSGSILEEFQAGLSNRQLPATEEYMGEYLKVLRVNNSIDDLLFGFLYNAHKNKSELLEILEEKKLKQPRRHYRSRKSRRASTQDHPLVKSFDPKRTIPSSLSKTNSCADAILLGVIGKLRQKDNMKEKDIIAYFTEAYYQGFIDLELFHYASHITDQHYKGRYSQLHLRKYTETVLKAKNKLVPETILETKSEKLDVNNLSDEQSDRLKYLTKREELYKKYNATQLIMLTQVLKKASMRMGVDPDVSVNKVSINFFYEEVGSRDNYVEEIILDPQSQFNLARRMLRADILNLQAMDSFRQVQVTYEDIVMASLETGYITIDDVFFVIKYDDLWNKKKSFWTKFKDFAFGLGGTASLFLPPPFNVIGTIGLVVAESVTNKNSRNGDSHVNPAAYID